MIIVNRTSGSDVDKVISLSNEEIGRPLSIGSDWTRIRIGIRYQVSSSTGNITNPLLAWGLCSGTSSMYNSNTTKHFVGIDSSLVDSWTKISGNSVQYSNGIAGTMRFVQKVSSSITVFENTTAYVESVTGSTNNIINHRIIKYIDFKKSSTSPGLWNIRYTTTDYGANSLTSDYSASFFYSDITNDTASLSGVHIGNSNITVPISESVYGYLDTFTIFWNKTSPPMEISDVAIYRFA